MFAVLSEVENGNNLVNLLGFQNDVCVCVIHTFLIPMVCKNTERLGKFNSVCHDVGGMVFFLLHRDVLLGRCIPDDDVSHLHETDALTEVVSGTEHDAMFVSMNIVGIIEGCHLNGIRAQRFLH